MERKESKLIYSDNIANVFVKAVPEYDEIIKKYGATKPFTLENSYTN
jgi:hypothetical protein